jgi:hypothetical protein
LINNTGRNIRSTFVKIQKFIRKVQSKKYWYNNRWKFITTTMQNSRHC